MKITHGNPAHRPAPGTGGHAVSDENPTGNGSPADSGYGSSKTTDPCSLVSQSQASTFTGTTVSQPVLAPLGPTCVYQEAGGQTEVTVVVQRADFDKLKPHIRNLSTVTVAGQAGYCGVYGTSTVYVPIAHGRILSITASCSVGEKFAATALPQLTS